MAEPGCGGRAQFGSKPVPSIWEHGGEERRPSPGDIGTALYYEGLPSLCGNPWWKRQSLLIQSVLMANVNAHTILRVSQGLNTFLWEGMLRKGSSVAEHSKPIRYLITRRTPVFYAKWLIAMVLPGECHDWVPEQVDWQVAGPTSTLILSLGSLNLTSSCLGGSVYLSDRKGDLVWEVTHRWAGSIGVGNPASALRMVSAEPQLLPNQLCREFFLRKT